MRSKCRVRHSSHHAPRAEPPGLTFKSQIGIPFHRPLRCRTRDDESRSVPLVIEASSRRSETATLFQPGIAFLIARKNPENEFRRVELTAWSRENFRRSASMASADG